MFSHPILTTTCIAALQATTNCCTYQAVLPLTEYADAQELGGSWGRAQSKARAGGLAPPGRLKGRL